MAIDIGRRQFISSLGGAALGSSLLAVGEMVAAPSSTSAVAAVASAAANGAGRTVKFHDGTIVPALGQGSWHLGQGRHPEAAEEEALRTGLSLGMTLIDTSENYGDGRSEELIGHAIAGQRDRVFLVSKVEAHHVAGTASRALARRASPVLAPTILISTCCTGQLRSLTSLVLSPHLKVYGRQGRFAPGAFPTSKLA